MTTTLCPELLQFTTPPSKNRFSVQDFKNGILRPISLFLKRCFVNRQNDLSYEQWNRLEYRHEMAGRVGEQMNPFGIR